MALKKTQIYSSLWASCDELRGGMDASQYKDYVLTLLFVKYVSDKFAGGPHGLLDVPEDGSFSEMVRLKNDKEIGEKINKIIARLAEANDLRGVIDIADFNNEDKLGRGKEMVDRLSNLIGIFENLDFTRNRVDGDDLLGDAYEYLMKNFATESGKSKGQFYTPAEVSKILAKVIGMDANVKSDNTVYDPTCGSGSLLLKVADEAPNGISIYGQEKDNSTFALARMNMILHNQVTAEIFNDNTLASPHWKDQQDTNELKKFDFAVANPPFSFKSWRTGIVPSPEADLFKRFQDYGTPPDKNGDYAFLLHLLKSLKPGTGKGAIILPHGVLFRGNAEADIRSKLLRQGFIKGIIGLPPNLFYGTGIPACIVVIDKKEATHRRPVFMIDASRGFIKDGNKNRLRSQDIHKIVDVFNKQVEIERYSRLVPFEELEKNEFNLNIPRYIDASDPEDLHDLSAHLQGGIPQVDIDGLENYWQVFPTLRNQLFAERERQGYYNLNVEPTALKQTILDHAEYKSFAESSLQPFEEWKNKCRPLLEEMNGDVQPKALIKELSEAVLARYGNVALLNNYNVFQLLMDYWQETMQDDVYLLVMDGWKAGKSVRKLIPAKDKSGKAVYKEEHDFVFNKVRYKSDLIPPALIIQRFFQEEQEKLNTLEAEAERLSQEIESLIEEHGGEEGLLDDARADSGKITKTSVNARIKEADDVDELKQLKRLRSLFAAEATAKGEYKDAAARLDRAVFEIYPHLSLEEVMEMVIEEKWFGHLELNIHAELEQAMQHLVTRIKELHDRYATPLPELETAVDEYTRKVEAHLKKMGLSW